MRNLLNTLPSPVAFILCFIGISVALGLTMTWVFPTFYGNALAIGCTTWIVGLFFYGWRTAGFRRTALYTLLIAAMCTFALFCGFQATPLLSGLEPPMSAIAFCSVLYGAMCVFAFVCQQINTSMEKSKRPFVRAIPALWAPRTATH
ncbi:MAG TPA: hypothetical protein VLA04_01900 [Verrucomicrobiae bacterium]|nr:hypothetical protein [Verrucomicrobiae bacterium]